MSVIYLICYEFDKWEEEVVLRGVLRGGGVERCVMRGASEKSDWIYDLYVQRVCVHSGSAMWVVITLVTCVVMTNGTFEEV